MNKFSVIGRLTKDPELKTLDNGDSVVNIVLAVDRDYKNKEGKKITDFLPFTLWDKNAVNLCEKSKKGALILLEGYNSTKKIQEDGYEKNIINPVVTKYRNIVNTKEINSEIPEMTNEEMVK